MVSTSTAMSLLQDEALLEGPSVAFEVGDSVTWEIPAALLCAHSGYFRERSATFASGHVTRSGPLWRSHFFRLFVKYMFATVYQGNPEWKVGFRVLVAAWNFGADFDAKPFQNHIMKQLHANWTWNPRLGGMVHHLTRSDVRACLRTAVPGSRLYCFILDAIAQQWHFAEYIMYERPSWIKALDEFPELLEDLFAFISEVPSGPPGALPLEPYLEDLEPAASSSPGENSSLVVDYSREGSLSSGLDLDEEGRRQLLEQMECRLGCDVL